MGVTKTNKHKKRAWTVCRFKKKLAKKEGFGIRRVLESLIIQCTFWWQKCFANFPKITLSNILCKDFLSKFCKSIFYVSQINCYCTYIFRGSNYRFSGLLSSIYFQNSYFDPRINNYLQIEFLDFLLYLCYMFNFYNFIFLFAN